MATQLLDQLRTSLAKSNSINRKDWARRIVDQETPLPGLMVLLHGEYNTAQRFTWLIGDVCELDSAVVAECLPLLFELRNTMPFPGMPRSVAKWLWLTNVPQELEVEAIEQLFDWLSGDRTSISCKSYSAKALFDLALQNRVSIDRLTRVLINQAANSNRAYGMRMQKLLERLEHQRHKVDERH